jgi:RNA polymerase sigma-70 factor (ECF subfamily)
MTALEFNYALHTNTKLLRPFAMKLTKNYDDANDLLQDTLMKAFIHRDKFEDGTNLIAWLYTIMRNTFITSYQKMIKRNTVIDNSDQLHLINSSGNAVDNEALGNISMQDIYKAINKLDEVHSTPFRMYFDGYKYHEIAEKLEIPIGTVKNRIHIARKELKDMVTR